MNKIICTLLLDLNDNYILNDGELPPRPQFDKRLLETFVQFEDLSEEGYSMLPPSLREDCSITHEEPYPITIPEIGALADVILVTRSYTYGEGKQFRLTEFEQVLNIGEIEIFRRKT